MPSMATIAHQVLSRGGTALNALIADRVYFGVTPSGFKNAQAAVVIVPEDGDSNTWNPVVERNYVIQCYGGDAEGGSWRGAEAVYQAVRTAWHGAGQITVAEGVMMQGWEEMIGVPATHPETKLKYYECRMAGKFRGA